MTEQTKQRLKYWLIGIISGGAVATPVTAFFVKRVYDKKIAKAEEEAEARGMNAMAEYAVQQKINQEPKTNEDADIPTADEINNWDVSIDDEEATEEARERTEEHERYLDMIHNNNYNGNKDLKPYIIGPDNFANENYMQKSYINWYEEDNVFEEDLRTIDDPYFTFGVTDGHELFAKADLREDPDICYVRSERDTTDYEITRIHGSYSVMSGNEKSIGEE